METPKILLHNKQSENSTKNKQKEKINEISPEQNKNDNDSASPLTKKPSQNSNFKILTKNKTTDNVENEQKSTLNAPNTSNTVRSYSSVVGTNDSNSTSNRIVIKAPLKETKQDEKQDQEDVIEEIDPFIIERLEDDNDRMFILRLEYEMTNLIKSKKESDIEYQNMNSYQRLIIHKIANYFKLCHINDRNNSSVTVIKTVASRIPKKKFYDIIAKPEDSNESETGNTEIKIMKRNDKKPTNNTNNNNNNNNKTVMKKKSNDHNIKKKNISLEERKLAYDLARARIFDETDQNSNNSLKPKAPKENKQNNQKRVDIEEDDDKDVYNRSNFIIKPQTPDYSIPQYFNQTYNQSPNMISQQKFQQSPYQKKFQKPMINPQLQQNPLMGQNPLMNQQQSSPNNLMNNNLYYSSPFHNNNNNSHSYSNIRNYSNFSPYNNVGVTSNNNPVMTNPLINNNKNNSNVPLNDLYTNNTNAFQNFTSPNQTPTKEHNSSSFNNSPISFQSDKKFMFSNSPISNNNGNNNNNNNNNNPWLSNKDFNFKNEYNVFNDKDGFENKGIPSFQTPSIYNNTISSSIPSSNYKKPIGMNNNEMNSIDSLKNNTSFSKLNPNSEIFIPNAKNNKLSINDSPISNMNTPLNVNVPEFNPYNHNRPSSSSSFSNNNKSNGNPNLFDPTRPINNTNNYYGGIGNNNKPQFMNYSNYNQNNSNKSNFFN